MLRGAVGVLLMALVLAIAGCGGDASQRGSATVPAATSSTSAPSSSAPPKATTTTYLLGRSSSTTVPEAGDQPVEPGTPHAWALAASALLGHLNGEHDDLLAGWPADPAYVAMEKEALQKWWGIGGRTDLLDMLQRMDTAGHRTEWEALEAYLGELSEDELAALKADIANDPQASHQVALVQQYAHEFGNKSLIGWDYIRCISLCRWGYLCGYISEEEAWAFIMPVAAYLQQTFDSWADLGENYLVGREFWSYEQTQVSGAALRDIYEFLVSSADSPWQQNPWGMDLQVPLPSEDVT